MSTISLFLLFILFNIEHSSFVQLNNVNSFGIIEKYKVDANVDTLLVFNENPKRPVATVSMSDIPTQTLSDVIAANQYLALPRLSSQDLLEGIYYRISIRLNSNAKLLFDDNEFCLLFFFFTSGICPAEWNRPRKRLCVILITENTEAHNEAREALRKIALESAFSADRVRFAYIYQVGSVFLLSIWLLF